MNGSCLSVLTIKFVPLKIIQIVHERNRFSVNVKCMSKNNKVE